MSTRSLAGLGLALALALSGCALGPRPSLAPLPRPTSASPVATASAVAPSWTVETLSRNDPALPVHLQWPVVPGAPALTQLMAEDLGARQERFLAEYLPSDTAPPELQGSWETVLDASAWVGIRIETYEFAGASGNTATQVYYGQRTAGAAVRAVDLITPVARQTAADALVAALRAEGRPVLDELVTNTEARDRLFGDLVFSPRGELVVRLGEGLLLPFSEGTVDVTLPPSTVEGVLSELGRTVRDAVVDQVTPSPTPTAAEPVTAEPPTGTPGAVDCAVVDCVALTFDDGPGRDTARLLDQLARDKAPATFFVLGSSVRANPGLVRRMAAEGHEVGTHTVSHKQLTKLGADGQRAEVRGGVEAVEKAGVTPTVFRPPYGSYDKVTRTVVGQPIILWDVDTLDWKTRSADATVAAAVGGAKAGSIVLMHDIHAPTVDAVPRIVAGLRERGFTLVTVSQLLGPREPGSVSSRR